MKLLRFLLLFLLSVSCLSNRTVVSNSAKELKALSSKKIVKNHQQGLADFKTLDARLKVEYIDNKNKGLENKQSLTIRLRMKKDSLIWIKGTKVVNAFRANITPKSFSFYSAISKEYFTGDYRFLKDLLGVEVSFDQLQNLFLGQSIINLEKGKYDSEVEDSTYKLTPQKQQALYNIFLFFNPNNFKIKQQVIEGNGSKKLRINYPDYSLVGDKLYPNRIDIVASENKTYTKILMDVKSVEFDVPLSTPYRIPSTYKELEFSKK